MSQVLPTDREHHDAETAARQVLAITLTNAPRLLVCDALAIWGAVAVPHVMANRIVRELAILAQQQRLFVAVRGAGGGGGGGRKGRYRHSEERARGGDSHGGAKCSGKPDGSPARHHAHSARFRRGAACAA